MGGEHLAQDHWMNLIYEQYLLLCFFYFILFIFESKMRSFDPSYLQEANSDALQFSYWQETLFQRSGVVFSFFLFFVCRD